MRYLLEGISVLDISQYIAGPSCCRMLADLGADVLQVQPPAAGPSPLGTTYNVGKRSIVLNLKRPEGVEIARTLATASDVIVESYRPGALEELGLGADVLTDLNPRLIYVSISGFGQNTASSNRRTFGANAQAEAGLLWVMQQAQGGETPFSAGLPVADIVTGMYACTAIVAALYDRERTGNGQRIDMALMDCQLAVLNEIARAPLAGQREEEWTPARHGLARCRDGRYITYNILFDSADPQRGYFRQMADALGHGDAAPPATAADAERLVAGWLGQVTVEEAARALDRQAVAYGVVKSMHEALADPHYEERRMVVEVAGRRTGETLRVVNSPWAFSSASVGPRSGPALPGADTRMVLRELGYSPPEIERLIEDGIVTGATP